MTFTSRRDRGGSRDLVKPHDDAVTARFEEVLDQVPPLIGNGTVFDPLFTLSEDKSKPTKEMLMPSVDRIASLIGPGLSLSLYSEKNFDLQRVLQIRELQIRKFYSQKVPLVAD